MTGKRKLPEVVSKDLTLVECKLCAVSDSILVGVSIDVKRYHDYRNSYKGYIFYCIVLYCIISYYIILYYISLLGGAG